MNYELNMHTFPLYIIRTVQLIENKLLWIDDDQNWATAVFHNTAFMY